jgi:hypothetical protein
MLGELGARIYYAIKEHGHYAVRRSLNFEAPEENEQAMPQSIKFERRRAA